MRFSVCHETHYRYSAPVLFAPHVLRLTPRSDNAVLLTHSLTVDPAPTIRQDVTDRHGNTITRVEFGDPSGHLGIESRFELETRSHAGAGFLRAAASALAFRHKRCDGGLFAAGRSG